MEHFIQDLKDIEDRVGSYTKAVIINSPNNPTGAMYSEEFIADVVEFCEKKDIWLIMDDIYHRLFLMEENRLTVISMQKRKMKILN